MVRLVMVIVVGIVVAIFAPAVRSQELLPSVGPAVNGCDLADALALTRIVHQCAAILASTHEESHTCECLSPLLAAAKTCSFVRSWFCGAAPYIGSLSCSNTNVCVGRRPSCNAFEPLERLQNAGCLAVELRRPEESLANLTARIDAVCQGNCGKTIATITSAERECLLEDDSTTTLKLGVLLDTMCVSGADRRCGVSFIQASTFVDMHCSKSSSMDQCVDERNQGQCMWIGVVCVPRANQGQLDALCNGGCVREIQRSLVVHSSTRQRTDTFAFHQLELMCTRYNDKHCLPSIPWHSSLTTSLCDTTQAHSCTLKIARAAVSLWSVASAVDSHRLQASRRAVDVLCARGHGGELCDVAVQSFIPTLQGTCAQRCTEECANLIKKMEITIGCCMNELPHDLMQRIDAISISCWGPDVNASSQRCEKARSPTRTRVHLSLNQPWEALAGSMTNRWGFEAALVDDVLRELDLTEADVPHFEMSEDPEHKSAMGGSSTKFTFDVQTSSKETNAIVLRELRHDISFHTFLLTSTSRFLVRTCSACKAGELEVVLFRTEEVSGDGSSTEGGFLSTFSRWWG